MYTLNSNEIHQISGGKLAEEIIYDGWKNGAALGTVVGLFIGPALAGPGGLFIGPMLGWYFGGISGFVGSFPVAAIFGD